MKQGKRIWRIAAITASLLLLIAIAATVAGSFYMLNYSLVPGEYMAEKTKNSYRDMYENYPFLQQWVDSLNAEGLPKDTFIVSRGLKLHAIYVPAPESTTKTAVIVHGYTDCAIRMLMIGYLYNHDLGYNILLPELQAHGESEGEATKMGWDDRLDVMRWTHVADSIFGGNTQMVVHGISMGGATTMMLSGEEQPSYMRCFVDDCGYTDVWSEFGYQLKQTFGLPEFPLLYTTSLLCRAKYGWDFKEASALKQVEKAQLPMLFIHGDADTYVPTEMVYKLYEAKSGEKELWIVPGATHAMSYRDNHDEYTERVKRFTERYIH